MSGQSFQRRNGSPSANFTAASSIASSSATTSTTAGKSTIKQGGPIMRGRTTVVPVTYIRGQGSPTRNNNNITNTNKIFSPSESPVSNRNVNVIGNKINNSQRSPSSPERKSPASQHGSPGLKDGKVTQKEKSKTLDADKSKTRCKSPVIRRTVSLDTIYLTGHWPRDYHHTYCGRPLVDESTQTPDEWAELCDKKLLPKAINQSNTDDQLDKIRQRLQRSKESSRQTSANGQHHSPIHGDHYAISTASNSALTQASFYTFPTAHSSSQSVSKVISIPRANIQKTIAPRMRNSVEGLNQEIEKLVLKGISGNEEDIERAVHEPTPDGHRAPVADILRQTRNANTQTPSAAGTDFGSSGGGTPSNSPASCCHSISPVNSGITDGGSGSRPSSQNDGENLICKDSALFGKDDSKSVSPEPSDVQLGTSPCINKFLAREPPDGCERVKIIEEFRKPQQIVFDPLAYLRPKPTNSAFKPSSSSAFYPPFKGYQSMATPDLAVLSPAATHPQNPSAATSIEG
ncbi:hypothetical protein CHUAL_011110 [Chamberlinius hualienensis]